MMRLIKAAMWLLGVTFSAFVAIVLTDTFRAKGVSLDIWTIGGWFKFVTTSPRAIFVTNFIVFLLIYTLIKFYVFKRIPSGWVTTILVIGPPAQASAFIATLMLLFVFDITMVASFLTEDPTFTYSNMFSCLLMPFLFVSEKHLSRAPSMLDRFTG